MLFLDKDASGTVRVLRWLTLVAFLLPALLFAAAAWKDRATILESDEDDGVRIAALFREQAENLFTGHEVILDMIVDRAGGRDWNTIQSPADLLRELELMDRRLDDESADRGRGRRRASCARRPFTCNPTNRRLPRTRTAFWR